ncbi:MAG: tetratricopeptide repeat protein, partial [Cyanobacteriota bacterium]|nr:tetratricopeptide repeat protein [Cyanobacteriota bacterium]
MKIHIHVIRVIITLIVSVTSPLLLAITTPEIFSVLAESVSKEDRKTEADWLRIQGNSESLQSKFLHALKRFEKELLIRREIGDKVGESITLNNIGHIYRDLGQYSKALDYYQKAFDIAKQLNNKKDEANNLNNMGVIYNYLGKYTETLDYYNQALEIYRLIDDKVGESTILNNIGAIYDSIGSYIKALDYYTQALNIRRLIDDKTGESDTLNNIGKVHSRLEKYTEALKHYQEALAIARQVNDKFGEGTTLNNIGVVYRHLGESTTALDYYQKALIIARQVNDKLGEGITLSGIGKVYYNLGKHPISLEYYQKALVIFKETGYKEGEAKTLNNIGLTLESQNKPELAIIYLKQSVNIYETIRQDLKALPREQQQFYTETVADTYRKLADLLLKQNRILEAQRVLDLLKVQELDDYLTNVRGNQNTSSGIPLLPQEEKVTRQLAAIQGKEIELGKELTKLQKLCSTKCTSAQENRKEEIYQLQQLIRQEYNAFIKGDEVKKLIRQLNQTAQEQNLRLANINRLNDNLQKDAVLLYPLILEDRLELILVTPNSPPIRRTATVKREDLNRTILEFRRALQNPDTNTKNPANKLYQWLIKPIENDLKQAETKTIIYAPDSTLRYIPLAALHDGEKWLIERFATHNITAASLD